MDHNLFFSLVNTVLTLFTMVLYYPLLKASDATDLYEAIKSRPLLAKAVTRKSNRSYLRVCMYFFISLITYMFIAIHDNVDMSFAVFTLFVLFLLPLSRVWMLRMMLGKP